MKIDHSATVDTRASSFLALAAFLLRITAAAVTQAITEAINAKINKIANGLAELLPWSPLGLLVSFVLLLLVSIVQIAAGRRTKG